MTTAGFIAGLDLVRCEDGALRVLEDNTRTPSGIAYAHAARSAVSAHFPTPPPASGPDPADAFGLVGTALLGAAPAGVSEPQVALLSDGPVRERRVPARELLDELLDACAPHARELGCERELGPARTMALETGAKRQLRMARGANRLRGLVETMADEFCADEDPHQSAPANAVSAGQ